jgi:hypothetical protein
MTGLLDDMHERKSYAGAIGSLSIVIIGLSTGPWIMRRQYEGEYKCLPERILQSISAVD